MSDDEQSHDQTDPRIKDLVSDIVADKDAGMVTPTADTVEFEFPTLTDAKKIAIVGFAGGHAHKAPFADDAVEKWGINQLWKQLPDAKFDRWFEVHDLYLFYHANEPHKQFLRDFTGPVYVRVQDYQLALDWGITTAQPFPHTVILDRFRPYFNNTVSWLVALAVLMQPDWIGLYGIDMAVDHLLTAEYSEQRPSAEYFIGVAEGAGIDVHVTAGSDLLSATHLYGYEDSGPVREKIMSRHRELADNKAQLAAQLSSAQGQMNTIQAQMAQMDGAMSDLKFWDKNWLTPPVEVPQ